MSAAAFDARYRASADPWHYRTSSYEQDKYAATLAACGEGPFASVLELGGSIGVFSALLAPRCASLTTVDCSAVAVRAARSELRDARHVRVTCAVIPDELEDGQHDLVVASEVLYYLEPDAFVRFTARLAQLMAPGGRLVLVHWRPAGPERPLRTDAVHDGIAALDWLRPLSLDDGSQPYRLDVLERVA